MITKAPSFVTSDKQTFLTLEAAQGHELSKLLGEFLGKNSGEVVLQHKAQVLDILTTTATSKPKARKVNGGTKKRKPAAAVNQEGQALKQ